jgi:pantoate--beta-alanine ligase
MGALHEGHLSLVRASVAEGRFTVATIFVNPTQFGPAEDFTRYPRDLDRDRELLALAGAELAFAPDEGEIYPAGFSTFVEPPSVGLPLEGKCRPGHFRGVATVVLKLFNLAQADAAYFGHKDYQQSLVVRRLVADLSVPIEIRVCPTVREPDGLALSSRNAYLSASERRQALALSQSLFAAEELVAGGERRAKAVLEHMKHILGAAGIERIDYVAIADRETLADVSDLSRPAVALVAAHVGKTRLIDNLLIGG